MIEINLNPDFLQQRKTLARVCSFSSIFFAFDEFIIILLWLAKISIFFEANTCKWKVIINCISFHLLKKGFIRVEDTETSLNKLHLLDNQNYCTYLLQLFDVQNLTFSIEKLFDVQNETEYSDKQFKYSGRHLMWSWIMLAFSYSNHFC